MIKSHRQAHNLPEKATDDCRKFLKFVMEFAEICQRSYKSDRNLLKLGMLLLLSSFQSSD